MASEPVIVVDHLWKRFRIYHEKNQYLKASILRGRRARYEEFWALRDVSLEVNEGEVFAIIGENGSGKSTLLKCLTRILTPDKGNVSVRRRMSALLELGSGFHPELTGRENVYLNGAILGLAKKEIDLRFDDIVQFAGLERFIDTPVKNYSSGMYVRLGFAIAINVDPEILIVDEVLAVGDAVFQQRCYEKFAEIRDAGKTLVVVTHDLGSVRSMADRAVWLSYGELKTEGKAGDVIGSYSDETLGHREEELGEHESRFGSGEVQITKVTLHGPDGKATQTVRTGEDVVIRFEYDAKTPVKQPVFGLAVYHLSGPLLSGPNTRDTGDIPAVIYGTGVVDIQIRDLPLLPGSYDINASVWDFPILHAYDQRNRALRFDVMPGRPRRGYGMLTLRPSWQITGTTAFVGSANPVGPAA